MTDDTNKAPVAPIIEGLGITHTPEPGELVETAIVLMKTIDADGVVGLRLVYPPSSSWLERVGMLHAATNIETVDLRQES